MNLLLAILAFPALMMVVAVVLYNRLVLLRNRYRSAFSQIDVQVKRRHDLISNLVDIAKGYLQHERVTLESVAAARAQATAAVQGAESNPGDTQSMAVMSSAEAALTVAMGRLLAISEAYPELKANQTMSQLMEDLTTTENRIAFARQAYNDAVMFYNTALQAVPANLIAGAFHFSPAEFFQSENQAAKELPDVSFS